MPSINDGWTDTVSYREFFFKITVPTFKNIFPSHIFRQRLQKKYKNADIYIPNESNLFAC